MNGLHNGEERYKRQMGNSSGGTKGPELHREVGTGVYKELEHRVVNGRVGGIVCVRVYAGQTLGSFFGDGLTSGLSLNELPF